METNFLNSDRITEEWESHEEVSNHSSKEVKKTIYQRLSRWFLCAGVFLLPLFFLPWTTSILEFNKQLLLLILTGSFLIFWLLHLVVSGQLSWRPNPFDKGVVAFLLATSLSTVFSIARFKSLFGMTWSLSDSLITVLALSIFYFGIVNVFDDKGSRVRSILKYSLFIVILYGVLNMFSISVFQYFSLQCRKHLILSVQ